MNPETFPYTQVRTRKSGVLYVFQSFPAKHRPVGWPSTVPLFKQAVPGSLTPAELEQIRLSADDNYLRFLAEKQRLRELGYQHMADAPSGIWTELGDSLVKTFWFEDLAPSTKRVYRWQFVKAAKILSRRSEWDPQTITHADLRACVHEARMSRYMAGRFASAVDQLMYQAIEWGLRDDWEPFRTRLTLRIGRNKRKIDLWSAEDVAALAEVADGGGDHGFADLVLTAWATGQRLGDLRSLRFGRHYKDGGFYFSSNKTNALVVLKAPPWLRARLDQRYLEGALMFTGRRGQGLTAGTLWRYALDHMADHPLLGARPLKLRHIRHSVVVELARSGCTIPQIASHTRHALRTIHEVLNLYLPHDPVLAEQAQAQREAFQMLASPVVPVVDGVARQFIGHLPAPQRPRESAPKGFF